MLRNGHSDLNNYTFNFVKICLEELNDSVELSLRYNALSVRLSKLEQTDFDKFMKDVEPKEVKKKNLDADLKAQFQQSLRN